MHMPAHDAVERLNADGLLPRLLADKTTKRGVIWATDAYSALGAGYGRRDEITPETLLRPPFRLMSRADKALSEQSERTKTHAEVFTPLRIVRKMNDYIEEDWFGTPAPFAAERVVFPAKKGKNWRRCVDSRRLEITCGEAPYLVTRYDATTGEDVPMEERAGILDRKLRVVNENAATEDEWLTWTYRAFQAVYGYEFQGDNVLLARLNLLLTFEEHMDARLHRRPTKPEYRKLLNIVAWNIWQMDGLTGTIPYCTVRGEYAQMSLFDTEEPEDDTARPPCRLYDWRGKYSEAYDRLKARKQA